MWIAGVPTFLHRISHPQLVVLGKFLNLFSLVSLPNKDQTNQSWHGSDTRLLVCSQAGFCPQTVATVREILASTSVVWIWHATALFHFRTIPSSFCLSICLRQLSAVTLERQETFTFEQSSLLWQLSCKNQLDRKFCWDKWDPDLPVQTRSHYHVQDIGGIS